MFHPRRPLTRRQSARFLFGLLILAWATQTLLAQWGFGATKSAEVDAASTAAVLAVVEASAMLAQNQTVERFVPATDSNAPPARLELRGEAAVIGEEVRLKQVARWSDRDAETFAPVADFVLFRLGEQTPFRAVSLEEIKSTLRDAGVNLAAIHFVGTARCTVRRVDVQYDESRALDQWISARKGESQPGVALPPRGEMEVATDANLSTVARVSHENPADGVPATSSDDSLRSILQSDLATRLKIDRDELQLQFRASDEKLLGLSGPQFRFDVNPMRAKNLGEVSWSVTITPANAGVDSPKGRVTVAGTATMWQMQLVAARPIAAGQVIRAEDFIERRALVSRLSEEPPLRPKQVLGQQSARDLKSGTVLTAALINPVPLVKSGQFVTITFNQGAIQVKTVAKALEAGAYGQAVRVRNETTREMFQVTVTGPQTAVVGPINE